MKPIITFSIIFFSMVNLSQSQIVMNIQTDKTEYKSYGRGSEDTIKVTYSIKNTGSESVILRWDDEFFSVSYIKEDGYSYSHCFTVYPGDYSKMYIEDYNRTKESFITIRPGEEITRTEPFAISWLCRGAPPRGDWEFNLTYNREITKDDNYYLLKRYYADVYDKEFVEDAWVGTIKSNSVRVVLK
jgi:hypothetical protein